MAWNFQFAFLGPQNNYLASMTRLSKAGLPIDRDKGRPPIESFGLPENFIKKYNALIDGHIRNIRGHDYLSHVGLYKNGNFPIGFVGASDVIIREIKALEPLLGLEDSESSPIETNLTLSLGPAPGSFFAGMNRAKRYRWANLPTELEDEVQKNVCRHGYGNIHDIAINSHGGWVMLTNGGKNFQYGRPLPPELEHALSERRGTKVGIVAIHLNHQNPDEYVLLFDDGHAYISLHYCFRAQIETLLWEWAGGPKARNFHQKFKFRSSSEIASGNQDKLNALYYSRRGLFHISRGNPDLAVDYLREAYALDEKMMEFYALALIAKCERIQDPILINIVRSFNGRPIAINPARLCDDNRKLEEFRNAYVWMTREIRYPLRVYEDQVARLQLDVYSEWSYVMASGATGPGPRDGTIFELPGSIPQQSHHDGDARRTSVLNGLPQVHELEIHSA